MIRRFGEKCMNFIDEFEDIKSEGNKMIIPLNNYYLVTLVDETQKAGSLFLTDYVMTSIRKALIVCCPSDDLLDLRPGDCVYINVLHGNHIPGEQDKLFINKDYIIAEYIDK